MKADVVLTALAASVVVLVTAGGSCPKTCVDDTFCVRECECEDSTNGNTIDCPIQFECNEREELCDEDYGLSCDELCGRFAPAGLCGSKTCATEADCVREVLCNETDPDTGQVISSFNCAYSYVCEADVLACEASYAIETDTQLCQRCAAQGVTAMSVPGR